MYNSCLPSIESLACVRPPYLIETKNNGNENAVDFTIVFFPFKTELKSGLSALTDLYRLEKPEMGFVD